MRSHTGHAEQTCRSRGRDISAGRSADRLREREGAVRIPARGKGWRVGGEPSPLELKISTPFPLVAHLLEILYPARE